MCGHVVWCVPPSGPVHGGQHEQIPPNSPQSVCSLPLLLLHQQCSQVLALPRSLQQWALLKLGAFILFVYQECVMV